MTTDPSGSTPAGFGRGRSGPVRAAVRRLTRSLDDLSARDLVLVRLAERWAGAVDAADAAEDVLAMGRAADKLLDILDRLGFGSSVTPEGGSGDSDGDEVERARLLRVLDGPPAVGD